MSEDLYDVAVVGGGMGGIYSSYIFDKQGLSVCGLEGGSHFGGVWHHNAYPGARVDTPSNHYCFTFSREIYDKWRWPERYAPQPELFRYLNFVADTLDIRRLFRFDTWVRQASWSSKDNRWHLVTDDGNRIACRFLAMCTGSLSQPRSPNFPGLERFKGQWVQTSRWPQEEVPLAGRRIGIIGTGSTGVQAIPVLAQQAKNLFVFQRHPHYTIPARNRPLEPEQQDEILRNFESRREQFLTVPMFELQNLRVRELPQPMASYSPQERIERLELDWQNGGHSITFTFSDQGTDPASNQFVSEFVRERIRERVDNPALAEKFVPKYPIGVYRLGLDTGYYETFKQDNVTLVDLLEDPIAEITETGVRTRDHHYELDLLIFAMGFQAFEGVFDAAGIRNESGRLISEVWAHGPRTLLGLMVPGFPNLFTIAGAGSPSVNSRLFTMNEYHAEWVGDLIGHMDRLGHSTIEPNDDAVQEWGALVDSYAEKLIRRQYDTYQVHVNTDGSRIYKLFSGGLARYVTAARAIADSGYDGFTFN